MRKLKLYITSTIDGCIATSDDDLSRLNEFYSEYMDHMYQKFLSEIDIVIMGGQTYRYLS